MTVDAPQWGSIDFKINKLKALMPKDYSSKIRTSTAKILAKNPEFTKSEAAALATHNVLDQRLHVLFRNEYNPEELRLEVSAKVSWASRQMDRVESNPIYLAATAKRKL